MFYTMSYAYHKGPFTPSKVVLRAHKYRINPKQEYAKVLTMQYAPCKM